MILRALTLAVILNAAMFSAAMAFSWGDTYEVSLKRVTDQGCVRKDYPDFILFNCDKELALYYFTKPGTAAYPGAMRRAVINEKDGAYIDTNAYSWGDDAAQPAFQAWMQRLGTNPTPSKN